MALRREGARMLCKFASAVLGRQTPKFLREVNRLHTQKGPEWLSERWKAIRNAAYKVREGLPDEAREVMKLARIRVRQDRPYASGVFGSVQAQYVSAENPHQIKACEALLRGYTGLVLDRVSKVQVKKAVTNITRSSCVTDDLAVLNPASFCRAPKVSAPLDGPTAVGLSGFSSYYCGRISIPKKLKDIPYSSVVLSSLVIGAVPRSLIDLLGENDFRKRAEAFQKEEDNFPGTLGEISILQEGGCKARVICKPSFWIQAYCKPLQNELQRRLLAVENAPPRFGVSCVLDQNRGANLLRQWMQEGRRLSSFDLSSATDRFPLITQLDYLEKSGLGAWKVPVQSVAQGPYRFPYTDREVSYAVGQPMGVNFSFTLFHLTHHSVLDSLSIQCKCPPGAHYAVLGDDVIIAHPKLAVLYKEWVGKAGVDISTSKSFEGVDLQTFAGFTGVTTKSGLQIFRPFKHGKDYAIEGKDVNLASSLGPKARKVAAWLGPVYQELNKTWPLRRADLSPIFPETDNRLLGSQPSSTWISSTAARVLDTRLKWSRPGDRLRSESLLNLGTQLAVRRFQERILGALATGSLGGLNFIKGSTNKVAPPPKVTPVLDGYDRMWGTLLREESPRQNDLLNVFKPDEYNQTEKTKRKMTVNQFESDPLIQTLRKDKRKETASVCTDGVPASLVPELTNRDKTGTYGSREILDPRDNLPEVRACFEEIIEAKQLQGYVGTLKKFTDTSAFQQGFAKIGGVVVSCDIDHDKKIFVVGGPKIRKVALDACRSRNLRLKWKEDTMTMEMTPKATSQKELQPIGVKARSKGHGR